MATNDESSSLSTFGDRLEESIENYMKRNRESNNILEEELKQNLSDFLGRSLASEVMVAPKKERMREREPF